MSLGNLQTHLYGLKNSQSVFNPQSTIFSFKNLKHCCQTSTSEKWEQEACPPPSGFTSSVRVHVHHWSSRTPSGFMSIIRGHVHHRSSHTPSGFTSIIRVHVHHWSSRTPSGSHPPPEFTYTVGAHFRHHPCGDDQERRSEGFAFNPPDVAGFQPGALMPGRLL